MPQVSYSICLPAGDPSCTVTHYVINPSQPDRLILAVHLEVFNRQANVVYLSIHQNDLSLMDKTSLQYPALDPFNQRTVVSQAGPAENTLLPFIWADGSDIAPTITMPAKCGAGNQNCELVGWVFFEVPKNTKPSQLVWDAADTIYLTFTS